RKKKDTGGWCRRTSRGRAWFCRQEKQDKAQASSSLDKTAIVVMNEVRVSSPYLPECVSGGTHAANDRVKKVLEFERKRLHARGGSQS
ncbi:hypothetical protein Tsubulata_041271, partial [Turnera subulata]